MNLSEYSVADLSALLGEVTQKLKERQHQERLKAREQIVSIAETAGISLEELCKELCTTTPPKKRGAGNKVAVRYRDPSNPSLQWTGRGRQPQWVREWISSGKNIANLEVN